MARVDEPERLNRYIKNFGDHNEDFKALALKLLSEFDNDVAKVARIIHVSKRTIYNWLEDWNKKKSRDSIINAAWGAVSEENLAKKNTQCLKRDFKQKNSGRQTR